MEAVNAASSTEATGTTLTTLGAAGAVMPSPDPPPHADMRVMRVALTHARPTADGRCQAVKNWESFVMV